MISETIKARKIKYVKNNNFGVFDILTSTLGYIILLIFLNSKILKNHTTISYCCNKNDRIINEKTRENSIVDGRDY